MAAGDPMPGIPTPTGTLQGMAAFGWSGSAWGPVTPTSSVGTPTGTLRGVAPYSWDGAAWQPAGVLPGNLDGVAVYTWNGTAWTPAGGAPSVPTPTGTLRGVAAFTFDGTAWQPASQRPGPDIATPYGVLDGVALFGWSGTAWTAPSAGPTDTSLDISFLGGTLDGRITFTRASTATYFDATGTMQTAAANAPRFDNDPVSHAPLGLLIEEARTNSLTYSSDQTNVAWNKTGGSASGVATAPDGTATANKFVEDTSNGAHHSYQAPAGLPDSTTFTASVFLKAAERTKALVLIMDKAAISRGMQFDLSAGTLSSFNSGGVVDPTGSGIVNIGNGWWRCWVTQSTATGGFTPRAWVQLMSGALNSYQGLAGSGLYIWGAQLELGAFPTSYIPTSGAPVTRAVDVATVANAGWINAASGTIAVNVLPRQVALTQNAEFVGLGTASSDIIRICTFSSPGLLTQTFSANTNRGSPASPGSITAGVLFKAAFNYTVGTLAEANCLNGGAVSSAAVSAMPAFATLFVGGGRGGPPSSWFQRVRYWPRALSNTELQQVTT